MSKSPARLVRFLLLLCGVLLAAPASADVFRAGEFTLMNGEDATSFTFIASVPDLADSTEAPVWPEGCEQISATRHLVGTRTQYGYGFRCDHVLRAGDTILTPWKLDGASFRSNVMGVEASRSLSGGDSGIAIPIGGALSGARSIVEIAWDYLIQGVLHIWMGWDHLAFVLCLCMIARGRRLIALVTAFTIGHSLSLSLAFFELVRLPVPPVEAIIALSIAIMAREALLMHRRDEGRDGGRDGEGDGALPHFRRQMLVVVAFGLLHGLGFASALSELGVQQAERVPALIFFNLGVEAGQLVFVAAMTAALAALRVVALARPMEAASMTAAGCLGCFWMVERIAGFLQA